MAGRTHSGVHAEPITFGFKMAIFYEEFKTATATHETSPRDHPGRESFRRGWNLILISIQKVEAIVCEELGARSGIGQQPDYSSVTATLNILLLSPT